MPNKRETFIKELYAQTYQLAQDERIPHDFIMAQVIQETGWGEHILKDTHNIFNIKADRSWDGERATFHVPEYIHGKKVWVDADFRMYDSYGESVADWIDFLHSNKRYDALFEEPDLSTAEFAKRIQEAGYATDPHYARNIVRITHGRTYKSLVGKAKEAYEEADSSSVMTPDEYLGNEVQTESSSKDAPLTDMNEMVVSEKIIPHKIDDFDERLFEEIALREQFRGDVYLDSVGIPTLGYGHAFFSSKGDLNIQAIRDVQASGMKVTVHDYHILRKIEQALHQHPRDIREIQHLANDMTLHVDKSEAKTLFMHAVAHKMDDLKEKIGERLYGELKGSKELLALADLTYNGGAGILYPSLLKALHEGNREEVWYKIRYTTNGGASRSKGIANRRVAESNIFGLTNAHISQENIANIEALMDRHSVNIARQEAAFPVTRHSNSPNPYAGKNSMKEQLGIAKKQLHEAEEKVSDPGSRDSEKKRVERDAEAQEALGVNIDLSEMTIVSKERDEEKVFAHPASIRILLEKYNTNEQKYESADSRE